MSILQAVVLGAVQGLTEFLPISSDGHLALVYRFLNTKPDLAFEVFLHLGTLIATIAYFRHDLAEMVRALLPSGPRTEERRFAPTLAAGDVPPPATREQLRRLDWLIVVGTVFTAAVALLLEDRVEILAENMVWVGIFFLVTAASLALAEMLGKRVASKGEPHQLPWWKSAFIGLAQGAAVLPGVSRSGTTIAAGMLSGLDRERAARYSFLLGVPIIAAANAKSALDVLQGTRAMPDVLPLAIGFIVATVTGYLAVAALLAVVRKFTLYWFAAYTGLVGCALLVATLVFKVF